MLTMGFPGRSSSLRRRHFTLTRDKLTLVSVLTFRGNELRFGSKVIQLTPESSLERQEGDDPRNFRLATPLAHDAPRSAAEFRLVQFCAATTAEMDSWLLVLRQNISMMRRAAEANRGHLHAADWNDTVHTGRGIPGRGSMASMSSEACGGGTRERGSTFDSFSSSAANKRRLSVLAPPGDFSLTPSPPEGGYGWSDDAVAGNEQGSEQRSLSAAPELARQEQRSASASSSVVRETRRVSIATHSDDEESAVDDGCYMQRMNVPHDAVPGASMFDIATWTITPPYLTRLAKASDKLEHPSLVIPIWCTPGQEVKVVWVAGEATCNIVEEHE